VDQIDKISVSPNCPCSFKRQSGVAEYFSRVQFPGS